MTREQIQGKISPNHRAGKGSLGTYTRRITYFHMDIINLPMTTKLKPKCEYAADYRICPQQNRIFICNSILYRHCNHYQLLDKQKRFREQNKKTIESLTEGKK